MTIVVACITVVVSHLCTPAFFVYRPGEYKMCTVPLEVPAAIQEISNLKGVAEGCGFDTKDFTFNKPEKK